MTKSKTLHVLPVEGGWAVKGEGRLSRHYPTKKAAVEYARFVVTSRPSGQVAVYRRDGTISEHITHGLPRVQSLPHSRRPETAAIERAVTQMVLARLS